MASPLLPFDATLTSADGQPYLMRMSQAFNEAIFFGSGQPKTPELAQSIERMMASVVQGAPSADPREAFLSRLMALSYQIEWLVTSLTGDCTTLSDHQAFLFGLNQLAAEVAMLGQAQGALPDWVRERLQAAQFRHFERFGPPASSPPPPVVPQQRPQPSVWTSLPHVVEPVMAQDFSLPAS